MVIGPEDNAGWCIVIGLRSSLLGSNAQVRFVPQLTPVVAQASRHCWLSGTEALPAGPVTNVATRASASHASAREAHPHGHRLVIDV